MTMKIPVAGQAVSGLARGWLGALRRWALPRPSDAAAVPQPPASMRPERISLEAQSTRASDYLADSIARACRLTDMQAAACEHLDSATYALERLFLELAPAMTIPGRTLAPVVVARIEPVRFERPERKKPAIAA